MRVLIERGIPAGKMSVIRNGVDLALFHPEERGNEVRARYGPNGAFVVLYVGTLGMAHGLEVVLRAARKARPEENIAFLLVGEGACKDTLRREGEGLRAVRFLDGRPREEVPHYIAAADACLVHLRRCDLFKTVLPSKMFEIMGCGRPILLGVDGEARRLLEQADAGVAFEPEDEDALLDAVRGLRDDPDRAAKMGLNGRDFAERHCSREALARRYAELLGAVA